MFVAAAIAVAFVATDPMAPFTEALRFVPRRSRFYEAVTQQLDIIGGADRWQDASEEIRLIDDPSDGEAGVKDQGSSNSC